MSTPQFSYPSGRSQLGQPDSALLGADSARSLAAIPLAPGLIRPMNHKELQATSKRLVANGVRDKQGVTSEFLGRLDFHLSYPKSEAGHWNVKHRG